jgi:hypothetical protein
MGELAGHADEHLVGAGASAVEEAEEGVDRLGDISSTTSQEDAAIWPTDDETGVLGGILHEYEHAA